MRLEVRYWTFEVNEELDAKIESSMNELGLVMYNSWVGNDLRVLGFHELPVGQRQCAAPDCNNIFIVPKNRGAKQKYCSAKCRSRVAQTRYVRRKSLKTAHTENLT